MSLLWPASWSHRLGVTLASLTFAVGVCGCGPLLATPDPGELGVALGPRGKAAGCLIHGLLPDPACTPGAIIATATVSEICVRGYAHRARDVTPATKWQVYDAYGIRWHAPRSYEIDHLVPLELGGANSIANLWPEAAPGYHAKDLVENALHEAVCAGRTSLRSAQRQIARDWRHTQVGPPR